ncbi:MAG TPA: alpha/beta fold hydrolase [Burkholderiales bacterium]|nr:alpha/beta fold hydrolase [Burkholderiales bacterium]
MSEYRAPWWLPGGHLQTILGAFSPAPHVTFSRETWETPDGDFIEVDWAGAPDAERLLVLFHGLEGSSQSPYARAIAAEALARGWRFALPHFRGCSGKLNRLPRAYHSGDSDEVDWILRRLAQAAAGPILAAGVSLGGNVLLKWLGERGADAARTVRRAVAVSAPLDLAASGNALDRGFNRRTYTRVFLATLKAKAFAKLALGHLRFDQRRLARARTLREFDDIITAPLHGFRDTDDYWTRAASAPWLARIQVPTLVLNARNDPFLPVAALERAAHGAASAVVLEFPHTGGHAGFPGRDRWLARRVLDFLSLP